MEKNFIEAASNGASLAISLVANIAANLIAFIALLHFVDSTLTWFGHRAGLYEPELTFQVGLNMFCVIKSRTNHDICRIQDSQYHIEYDRQHYVIFIATAIFTQNVKKYGCLNILD